LHRGLRNFQQALEDFTRAIECDPCFTEAYERRGLLYEELQLFEQALDDYNKATECSPEKPTGYNLRGHLLYRHFKMFEEAMDDYNKALDLDPRSSSTFYNRGNLYGKVYRNYDKAIEDLSKAISIDPECPSNYCCRSEAFENAGKLPEALNDLNKALELSPDRLTYINNRASLYNKLKNYDAAVQEAKVALVKDPNYPYAYAQLAMTNLLMSNWQEAEKCAFTALSIQRSIPRSYYVLGCVLEQRQELSEALKYFDHFLKLGSPDFALQESGKLHSAYIRKCCKYIVWVCHSNTLPHRSAGRRALEYCCIVIFCSINEISSGELL